MTAARMNAPRGPIYQAVILLIGRILIALPLIKFGTDKVRNFDRVAMWMQSIHMPLPALLLGLADTIEVIGALCLIAGFWTRRASLVIGLYLILVHVVIHNFWGPDVDRAAEIEQFGKGMMIIGGLLFVFVAGAGVISIDNWLHSRTLARRSMDSPQ